MISLAAAHRKILGVNYSLQTETYKRIYETNLCDKLDGEDLVGTYRDRVLITES